MDGLKSNVAYPVQTLHANSVGSVMNNLGVCCVTLLGQRGDDEHEALLAVYFQLVSLLCLQQQPALTRRHVHELLATILDLVESRRSVPTWAYVDGLRCLGHVLHERACDVDAALLDRCFVLLHELCQEEPVPGAEESKDHTLYIAVEARRMAIGGLGSVALDNIKGLGSERMNTIFRTLLGVARNLVTAARDDFRLTKTLATSLRALLTVVESTGAVADTQTLLSLLRNLLAWGVALELPADHVQAWNPHARPPSPSSASASSSSLRPTSEFYARTRFEAHAKSPFFNRGVYAGMNKAKHPSTPPAARPRSSSSSQQKDTQASSAAKVRLRTMQLLQAMVKLAPKAFYRSWTPLLPSNLEAVDSPRPFSGPNVISVLLYDPFPKVKHAAAAALADMIKSAPMRRWLPSTTPSGPLTGLHARYMEIFRALHAGLHKALVAEPPATVQSASRGRILGCISALAANTPYAALARSCPDVELLAPILGHLESFYLRPHLHGRDTHSTRHAVYSALISLFDTQEPVPELERFLCAPPADDSGSELNLTDLLVVHASRRAKHEASPHAITVLGKMAKHYPSALARVWRWDVEQAARVLDGYPVSSAACGRSLALMVVRDAHQSGEECASALRLVEEWARTPASQLAGDSLEPSSFFAQPGACDLISAHLPVIYKRHAEPHADPLMRQDTVQCGVRSRVLNCLAFVPYVEWVQLDEVAQRRLMELALQATHDTKPPVRASACRFVGAVALYTDGRSLSPPFVEQAVRELQACLNARRERVLVVRVRACWALANLCDSALCQSSLAPLHERLGEREYCTLARAIVSATADSQKVVANAVRAAGNVARWIPLRGEEEQAVWQRLCEVLTRALTAKSSVKSQWNACYATGCLLANPQLPAFEAAGGGQQVTSLLVTLASVIQHSENFKVRINAAVALAAVPSLEHYGEALPTVAQGLLATLGNYAGEKRSVANFTQTRYLESLRSQLLRCVLHICELCQAGGAHVEALVAHRDELQQAVDEESRHLARPGAAVQQDALTAEEVQRLGTAVSMLQAE